MADRSAATSSQPPSAAHEKSTSPSTSALQPAAATATVSSARPIPITRRSSSTHPQASGSMARSFTPSLPNGSIARSTTRGTPSEKVGGSRRRTSAAGGARRPSAATLVGERSASVAPDELSDEMFEPGKAGDTSGKEGGKGKKQEIYQCESCRKFYKHPACLSKHRWQHTEYWQEASKYQLSKHQSVQMLEAAAILVHPTSLPQEKSLWPAAVSAPSSGLFGSSELNRETLRRFEAQHIGSPPAAAFAQLALIPGGALPPPSSSSAPRRSEMAVDSDDQLMENDDDYDGGEMMFDFELGSGGGPGSTSTAPTTLRSGGSGSAASGSGGEEPTTRPVWGEFARPAPMVARPSYAAYHSQQPAVSYGVSAPPIGFFEPRSFSQAPRHEPLAEEMDT